MAKYKFPWERDTVNEKVKKQFLLHMPEPMHLQLKILAAYSKQKSIQKYCWKIIKERIDEDFNEAIEEDRKYFIEFIKEMES